MSEKKKRPIELNIDIEELKRIGREKKKKFQNIVESIEFDEIKEKGFGKGEKLRDKMAQMSTDRQKSKLYDDIQQEMEEKNKNIESFVCSSCGATMEMVEDKLHHRKIVCPACGNTQRIYDSDKDRVKREKADQEIYEMQYKREHPVKHEFKIMYPIIIMLCIGVFALLFLASNDDSIDTSSQLKPPISASEVKGMNYKDVKLSFENAGFTNIQTETLKDLVIGWLKDDGDVEEVSVNGKTDYSTSTKFEKDVPVIIRYHTYATDVDDSKSSNSSTDQRTNNTSAQEEILTMENCPELAAILTSNTDDDSAIIAFAEKYKNKTIKFDGSIKAMNYHGDYHTRFDILVGYGNYDPNTHPGPYFQFEDVGASNLGISTLYLEDELAVGDNVTITAKVDNYNHNNLLFYLKPVSVVKR